MQPAGMAAPAGWEGRHPDGEVAVEHLYREHQSSQSISVHRNRAWTPPAEAGGNGRRIEKGLAVETSWTGDAGHDAAARSPGSESTPHCFAPTSFCQAQFLLPQPGTLVPAT